jgi:hypothetical protein
VILRKPQPSISRYRVSSSIAAAGLLLAAAVCTLAQDFRSSLIMGPYTLSFAEVVVGQTSDTQTVTLMNSATSGGQVDKFEISGPFTYTTDCPAAPMTLAKNQACGVTVSFKPTATGPATGMLSVFHDKSADPLKVSLSGTGTSTPSSVKFSPTSLDFSQQNQGTTSGPETVAVTGSSEKTLLISDISVEGDFTITPESTCEKLIGAPSPNAKCTIVVTFTPLGSGKRQGAIVLKDDAPDSPQRVPLSGTGKASE